jgi:hypothetical protein
MKVVAVLCCAVAAAYACTDGVDNVINLSDCGSSSALAKFSGLQVWTYDSNKTPTCKTNSNGVMMGDVQLPGYIKIAQGTVTVSQSAALDANSKLALTVEKLHSVLIHNLCIKGASQIFLIPDEVCQQPFCTLIGQTFCDMLNKPGTFTIQNLPASARGLIQLPKLTGILSYLGSILSGEWYLGADIITSKGDVACIRNKDIPFNE